MPQRHVATVLHLVHSELVAFAGHLVLPLILHVYITAILYYLSSVLWLLPFFLQAQTIAIFYILYDGSFHAVSHSVSKYEAKDRDEHVDTENSVSGCVHP